MSIMSVSQRSAQIWSVLGLAARNRQILTYQMVGKLVGVPARGLGQLLEPIQSYCLLHNLPPLTILVVLEETGLPSTGFSAALASELPKKQLEVFAFDWIKHMAPKPDDLDQAVKERPSRGREDTESRRPMSEGWAEPRLS